MDCVETIARGDERHLQYRDLMWLILEILRKSLYQNVAQVLRCLCILLLVCYLCFYHYVIFHVWLFIALLHRATYGTLVPLPSCNGIGHSGGNCRNCYFGTLSFIEVTAIQMPNLQMNRSD